MTDFILFITKFFNQLIKLNPEFKEVDSSFTNNSAQFYLECKENKNILYKFLASSYGHDFSSEQTPTSWVKLKLSIIQNQNELISS